MLTLRATAYSDNELLKLQEIIDYWRRKPCNYTHCETCPVKHLCDDLLSLDGYLDSLIERRNSAKRRNGEG